jgi:cytochrome c oxidase assembly factor CtaG
MPHAVRAVGITLAAAAFLVSAPSTVLAHGVAPDPVSLGAVLTAWSFDAHVWLPVIGAWLLYGLAVRRVNEAHPRNPVPRWRAWSWYAGMVVLIVALQSPIEAYDTTLFSVHMVQHLLLTLVAAPLLALAAPITLLLRVSSAETRQRFILPLLHSRPVRAISFPVVTWVLFAGVMWISHFSPLYDAALDNEALHVFEHALYLGVSMLFWWPVVGADPSPWRMPHAARIFYLFLGMPQSSFLGLAIFSAPDVMYPHYATLERSWGPSPLADQQLAGGIMWVGGDLIFLVALILAVWTWMRADEAEAVRVDARLERERLRQEARVATAERTAAGTAAKPPDW